MMGLETETSLSMRFAVLGRRRLGRAFIVFVFVCGCVSRNGAHLVGSSPCGFDRAVIADAASPDSPAEVLHLVEGMVSAVRASVPLALADF